MTIRKKKSRTNLMMQSIGDHLGKRIFLRRRLLHLTQKDVAEAIGVTYQQIQKYECGASQISAGRVWLLASALGTSVEYFYDGLPAMTATPITSGAPEPGQDFQVSTTPNSTI